MGVQEETWEWPRKSFKNYMLSFVKEIYTNTRVFTQQLITFKGGSCRNIILLRLDSSTVGVNRYSY